MLCNVFEAHQKPNAPKVSELRMPHFADSVDHEYSVLLELQGHPGLEASLGQVQRLMDARSPTQDA